MQQKIFKNLFKKNLQFIKIVIFLSGKIHTGANLTFYFLKQKSYAF